MKVFVICVAFGNVDQVHASLNRFNKSALPVGPGIDLDKVVVNGHFPLNYKSNQALLPSIVEEAGFRLMDPGRDLGSAQSQTWALKELGAADGDYFLNLDPDSACDQPGWLDALVKVMESEKKIAILSLNTFWHWERIHRLGVLPVETRFIGQYRIQFPLAPDLFNLSLWRVGALNRLGGVLQGTAWWGNVESHMIAGLKKLGYRTALLYNFMEATDLKLMQPAEFIDWKKAHGIDRSFDGSFGEYCKRLGRE